VNQQGRPYLADGWAGSVTVLSSEDHGQHWKGVPLSIQSGTVDRPWITTAGASDVYVTGMDIQGELFESGQHFATGRVGSSVGGAWVARSTDGGSTFPQQVIAVPGNDLLGFSSNLAITSDRLLMMYTKELGSGNISQNVAVSDDHGQSWRSNLIGYQTWDPTICMAYPVQVFPVIAADAHGRVFAAWTMTNSQTNRLDLFFTMSADAGEHWQPPALITDRPGTRLFPWLATDPTGHVGLAWYESNKTLYPAHASTVADRVTCPWGDDTPTDWVVHYAQLKSTSTWPPVFSEATVPTPAHRGPDLGRPFAEMLHVAYDRDGRAGIAYVSDFPSGQAHPMFALANAPK
jgi:hypothetical protein